MKKLKWFQMIIRRAKSTESWGFHVQEEGIVTDVEMYQMAWKAGLRQGSRIVEVLNVVLLFICKT